MSLQIQDKLFSVSGLPDGSVTFFREVAQGFMVLQPFTERWLRALWFRNLLPKGGGRAAESL